MKDNTLLASQETQNGEQLIDQNDENSTPLVIDSMEGNNVFQTENSGSVSNIDISDGTEKKKKNKRRRRFENSTFCVCFSCEKCTKEYASKMTICVVLSLIGLLCFGTRNWLLSYIAHDAPDGTDIISSVWGWCGTGILGGIIWLILIPTRYRIKAVPVGKSLKDMGCKHNTNNSDNEQNNTINENENNCPDEPKSSNNSENNTNELKESYLGDESCENINGELSTSSSSKSISAKDDSPMIAQNNNTIKHRFGGWDYILPLFLGGIGSALGLVSINVAYSVASDAKGQITAITSSVSAFVALFTFLILREIINVWQTVGITVTIAGVIMISVDSNETADFVAFAFGILTAILESICNVAIGYCTKNGMDKLSNGIVLSVMILLDWVLGLPVLAIIYGTPIGQLETWMVFASIGAGMLTTLGLIVQNIAIGMWATGAVSAITNSNAIVVMFWDWVIYGKIYSALAISGVFVVLSGTAVLALSPKSKKRWGTTLCRKKKEEVNKDENSNL